MISSPKTFPLHQFFGWGDLLFLSLLGFLLGPAMKIIPIGRYNYSTVVAARCPEAFRPMRLPVLPVSILGALALPVLELLGKTNSGFRSDHEIYLICMVAVAASVFVWLVYAVGLLEADDRRKTNEIREFLSDADAPVAAGPPLNVTPVWLRVWNSLNLTDFLFLVLTAIRGFSHQPMAQ